MASFFITHSSEDTATAERVRLWLERQGFTSVFLDSDPEDGIVAGRRWEDELYSELRKADVVLFVSSEAALDSKWCHSELVLARSLGRTIVPILLHENAKHPLVADTQWVRLENGSDDFEPLAEAFRRLGIDRLDTLDWDETLVPYPGLAGFDENRAGVFFGRDDEIGAVLDRLVLRNTQPLERLVLVAGPSGSGKSSLVRAGVVPRLRLQEQPWFVVPPFRPGNRPLTQLAQALSTALAEHGRTFGWRECLDRISRGPDALGELVDDLLVAAGEFDAGQVLVVIDQGEQLATQPARQERIALLDLLGGAMEGALHLSALVTLRSEYLTELVEGSVLEGGALPIITVGRLAPERLAEVIERPAGRAGIAFEPGLVQRMVEETTAGVPAGGDPLPLLAFALRQVYDTRSQPALVAALDYERSGGVVGGLKAAADGVFGRLRERGAGDRVVPTLLELVHVEPDRPPSSRSVPRSQFADADWEVIEAFVDARLLTTEGPEPVVHVAHEALLREWPLLARAIESFEDELLTRSRLGRDAREWQLARRDDSYLLGGTRLQAAIAATSSRRWTPDPLVDEYVAVSRSRARRDRWRSRIFVGLAAAVAAVLLGLAGWFVVDRVETARARDAAHGPSVPVGALRVDVHEVTEREYGRCVAHGPCDAPHRSAGELDFQQGRVAPDERAVTDVAHDQATAFCHWIGWRLPTAAEAMTAARSGHEHRFTQGGREWTASPNGRAFRALYKDPKSGSLRLDDVRPGEQKPDLTFRCVA